MKYSPLIRRNMLPTTPIDTRISRERETFQMLPADAFDSLVQLTTHTVRHLNDAVRREEIPVS